MAAYNVTTKVIVHSIPDGSADSVANSYAKEVNDYIQGLDSTSQAIVNIHSVARGSSIITTIVHYS